MCEPSHSCERMRELRELIHVVDVDVDERYVEGRPYLHNGTVLTYNPKFDEYGLNIPDGGTSTLSITHCPWCGQRLPDSRRDEWFDGLGALGVEPDDAPAEMRTSAWWRAGHRD